MRRKTLPCTEKEKGLKKDCSASPLSLTLSHLNLLVLETPLETNSGYATDASLKLNSPPKGKVYHSHLGVGLPHALYADGADNSDCTPVPGCGCVTITASVSHSHSTREKRKLLCTHHFHRTQTWPIKVFWTKTTWLMMMCVLVVHSSRYKSVV